MNKKPLGIILPLKIQKVIYPSEKIQYESPYILATLFRRLTVLITYYILYPLRVSPNLITIISIILCLPISYCFINQFFFVGSILACVWVALDNIDGELARIQKKTTNLGGVLERLSSDIFYLILFPSLSVGLYNSNQISIDLVIATFFCCLGFNVLRSYISNFPDIKMGNNFFISFAKCQFKNSIDERKKNFFGSIFFYSWRNIFTQCGLNELILLVFTIPLFNLESYLNKILIIFNIGYFIISLTIILSILFLSLFIND